MRSHHSNRVVNGFNRLWSGASRRSHVQFFRFVVVGMGVNAAGYLTYLLLTWLWLEPKVAMSALYVLGTALSYALNRRWSFRSSQSVRTTAARFAIAYASGYVLNFTVLWWAVDGVGMPHELVQGCMAIVLACGLFLLQKYWVFRAPALVTSDDLPQE